MSSQDRSDSEKDYRCDYGTCTKHYKTKFSLRRHYLAHMGIRLFPCPHCTKRFSLGQHLMEHIYTHTGEKPYVCTYPGCHQCFRQAGKLSIHKKIHNLTELTVEGNTRKSSNFSQSSVEAVLKQIENFQLPSFFYSKTLPIPTALSSPKSVASPLKGY